MVVGWLDWVINCEGGEVKDELEWWEDGKIHRKCATPLLTLILSSLYSFLYNFYERDHGGKVKGKEVKRREEDLH